MTDTTKHTVKKLLLKLLMVLLVLAALDVIYYYTLYPKDLAENCTLKALSERATEGVDIVYLGESSNHTYSDADTDKRFSFLDTAKLYDWAFSEFQFRELSAAGKALAVREAALARGDGTLRLLAGEDLRLPLPPEAEPELRLELRDPELRAPLEAGQELGSAVFLLEGRELARVTLLADRSIPRSIWAYVSDTVQRYHTQNGSSA